MAIARIRTLKEAYAEIKEADPKSAVSQYYIKQLIMSGAVPAFKSGGRYLVNMEALENYLANPEREALDRQREYEAAKGKIRAVPE